MRKEIHNKLIMDFSALTFTSTTVTCFADVKKFYFDAPEVTPVARIVPSTLSIDVVGNTTEIRQYGYQVDVYELIEASTTQAEAELKIDRLSNIEDTIMTYLRKLPNNLEYDVAGVHIIDIGISESNYSYELGDTGIVINLGVPFTLSVNTTPQLL
jgi:hypothetical protein